MTNKLCLLIMDGWGIAPSWGGNATTLANTPNYNQLWRTMPHTELYAAAEAVGLPRKEVGNSEVGHLNIGAGHVIHQDLLLINNEITDGAFFSNRVLLGAFQNANQHSSNIHLVGLLSPGGVHSHINHLYALLEMAKRQNFDRVYLHLFTDGRDTAPMDALSFILKLKAKIKELGIGKIASIAGRYYAMDRNGVWPRTRVVYDMLTSGVAPTAQEPEQAITSSYQQGINDEFIKPVKIGSEGSFVPIEDNDSVIIFNFRRDRIDQLTRALILPNFDHFNRRKVLEDLYIATFTTYESKELPILSAFHAKKINSTLAAILASNGLKQFHIAETEKYAHVTYFLNGGIEQPFPGEDRLIIPSPSVATYNLSPQMSAYKVTEAVVEKIKSEEYDFIVVNFANPDMVGHTGDLHATMVACETVDLCVGKIIEENRKRGIVTVVTADHGNAEQMVDPNTGEPYTEHTTNPVPFIIIPNEQIKLNLEIGNLANIVPTVLTLMGIPIPENIIGSTLTEKEANADRTT